MNNEKLEEQKVWKDVHPRIKQNVHTIQQNSTIENGKLFDISGQDVSHLFELTPKTNDKQYHGLQMNEEFKEHSEENGGFIFAFFKESNALQFRYPDLKRPDIARLIYIATFIRWESNRLQSDNGRKHYNKSGLRELVGMSRKRFNEFFNRLLDANIIREADTGELFINPTLFYRGEIKKNEYNVDDYDHTRLFKGTIRELFAEFNGRKLGQLSIMYSVLPFLNFKTNVVCYNPSETVDDLIKPITLGVLTDILGYVCPQKLKTVLDGIKLDGKPVFKFLKNPQDRRTFRIVINPRVVFAGNGESLKTIKGLFN